MPIRLMVASLLLKRICNLGDKTLCQDWLIDPYMQYFCGMAHFEYKLPCGFSDFVHFRKPIVEAGVEKVTPDYKPLKQDNEYTKRVKLKKFKRIAAIEPVIGHLKSNFQIG